MKKHIPLLVLLITILSSMILEITGISLKLGSSYAYIFKPMIWCFLLIIIFVFFRNDIIPNNKYKNDIKFYVIITILVYILVYFSLGYANGFARNPYDNSIKGILLNLWSYLPIIIAKEYARYYIINHIPKKKILLGVIVISVVFTITEVNLLKLSDYFLDSYTIIKFLMEIFIPSFIINLYLSYICYYTGYYISILYLLIPQFMMFSFPILPDLEWSLMAIINSGIPFFSYVFINYYVNKNDKTISSRTNEIMDIKGWGFMLVIILVIVTFGLDFFPIKPLVIASDSMYPQIHKGDIVLIVDIDPKEIKIDDIIRYKIDSYYVVHRVKDINISSNGEKQFIMKGDNNENIDLYPVEEYQIHGIIKYKIPYAGYPTLFISRLLKRNVEDVVVVETGKR